MSRVKLIKLRAEGKTYHIRPDDDVNPEIGDFVAKFLEGLDLLTLLPESIRFDKFEVEVDEKTITVRERIITPRSGGYWVLFRIERYDDGYVVQIYRTFDVKTFYEKLCGAILGFD